MTINRNFFIIEIDQQILTEADAGVHEITVTLGDDGPTPKFENESMFSIEIEYTAMSEEELKEYLELLAFEGKTSNLVMNVPLDAAQSESSDD